ncbi:ferrochelatase [Corynebacterium humireducens NBRC 106098 = DSM 45392]|uniref:Coproporphyrin III ferrochelatase n=1 Tax=Corynebacterium humireducens NBRC 106098 = DSM 45392 TaxID=1223515 RepID=A0A0B5DAG8_9CORY|nr:ferrochelatase [Corynebacterium humireducens]AJE33188.1 ferrochelatase [Corynebacterium humireducens NBRC 106098 = DSM 45392]
MADELNFDALLVLSFGGPEGDEEVVPFLENVTRGRGIPRERLEKVGEHYFHFGGVSPLNRLNREIIGNLEKELASRGMELPVYFGNRNWHPFGEDTAEQMSRDGVRRALVFATSAWGGYSACLQYNEDIRRMIAHLEEKGVEPVEFTKLRQFYDHPVFVRLMADAVRESLDKVPAERRDATRVLFTAHSVPTAADEAAGGPEDPHLYSRQVAEASRLIAEAAGVDEYDVVWQSRSGDPRTPWLEPDIVDHTTDLAAAGVTAVVVCPVGFISDHMEVIWDLDTELVEAARDLGTDGVHVERTRTAGPEQEFAGMVVDIIGELVENSEPASLGTVTVQGCTVNGAACRPGCCQVSRPNSRTA